jgi:ankyrin repeat protein
MIEMLVKNGANPDRTDNSGRSARDYAALMGARSGVLEAIEKAEGADEGDAETYGPN